MQYTPDEERQIAEQLAHAPPGYIAVGTIRATTASKVLILVVWDAQLASQPPRTSTHICTPGI